MNRDRNKYQSKYQLNRYHNRRKFAIEFLGGKCVTCGSIEALELDHKEPKQKEFSISKMWSVSEETYIKELNKCQLLCNTCHAAKTKLQHTGAVRHGEGVTGKRSCYCALCAPLKRAYRKKFKR